MARLFVLTGCPRSSTTAVGRVLSIRPGAASVHEPLNRYAGAHWVKKYFVNPRDADYDEDELKQMIDALQSGSVRVRHTGWYPDDGFIKGAGKLLFGSRNWRSTLRMRSLSLVGKLDTVFWKDPFAIFLSERIVTLEPEAKVVVLVRNPYAVANSFKRMGWGFDLEELAAFEGLTGAENWLARSSDPVINAALLWSMCFDSGVNAQSASTRVRQFSTDHLSRAPERFYNDLSTWLGISAPSPELYQSKDSAAGAAEGKAHQFNRNLSQINAYWKRQLSEEEISAVSEIVGERYRAFESLCCPEAVGA